MSFLSWLCPDRDPEPDPRPLALETPGTWTLERAGELVVDVTIRSTEQLHERTGRIPEEMAAVFLAGAFAQAGLGYRIRFGFDPVAIGTQHAACRDEDTESPDAKDLFADRLPDLAAARDANLILTDAAGGGCAQWWEPRCGAVGVRDLDARRAWTAEGSDDWHRAIQRIEHETGHCLGASHDHDPAPGRQYPGTVRLDHDRREWRYSPTVYRADGTVNRCGEPQPDRAAYQDYEWIAVHEFHDCAIEVFEDELRRRE